MNAARIRKLVTAGFITALLVTVPAESQALTPTSTPSSAALSSTGATDAVAMAGSAAVAPAHNVASWPAGMADEVKKVLIMPSGCTCPNTGEVVYALKELGVKALSLDLLVKRLGKVAGHDAFATLVASLNKKAPALKKRIPFPDYKSKSATTYAKSPYRVYEIFGTGLAPVRPHWTWKYGITRQMIPAQRPQGQLKSCTKYFGPPNLITGSCTYQWIWKGVGWLQARTIEASYTLLYALQNNGKCPPGMPACI